MWYTMLNLKQDKAVKVDIIEAVNNEEIIINRSHFVVGDLIMYDKISRECYLRIVEKGVWDMEKLKGFKGGVSKKRDFFWDKMDKFISKLGGK